jgi:hypothetical protein
MDQKEILQILHETRNIPVILELFEIQLNGKLCKGIYQARSEDSWYSIKIRPKDDALTQSAISVIQNIEYNFELFFSPYLHILESDSHLILIKEWEYGESIDETATTYLPDFFAKLARFNLKNASDGKFISMYADGRYASTIDDLISHEIEYHFRFWKDESSKNRIVDILQALYTGFGCIISEDNNLANLIVTENSNVKLIDLDWIQSGSNLYQFDHFSYFTNINPKRYAIHGALAKECYDAYFSELPGSRLQANDQIRAIEVLSTLRKNTYNRFFENQDQYGTEISNLKRIEQQHLFI